MYTIIYSLDHNKSWEKYDFHFDSLWGAVFKARAICIQHWAATDVIDKFFYNIYCNSSWYISNICI